MNQEKETRPWYQLCQFEDDLHVLEIEYESELKRVSGCDKRSKMLKGEIGVLIIINMILWTIIYLSFLDFVTVISIVVGPLFIVFFNIPAIIMLIRKIREYIFSVQNDYFIQAAIQTNKYSIAVQRQECTANMLKIQNKISCKKKQIEALKIEVKEKHYGEIGW